MKPKVRTTQLTDVFNRPPRPPEVKAKPSLQDQVKKLNKLLSKPALTYEMSGRGSVNSTFDRNRDRHVRHEIRQLEARIEKQGYARSSFKAAHMPGTAKQSFSRSARRR